MSRRCGGRFAEEAVVERFRRFLRRRAPPVAPMSSGPQPPGSKAGCSNGCKTTMVGCGGVVFGIVLTIGVEFWAGAAGVQAVQDAF